ncbi:MAG: DUF2802 domain-containing protein [Methyloglobulus sp.]|nr:DUF2802 domain-containing protein [Methyloglobulus sp.]
MPSPLQITIILAVVTGLVCIIVMTLVWLVRKHIKINRTYSDIADIVHGNNNDIRELCAAKLTIDDRITAIERQLSALSENISDNQNNESSKHPYSLAIQKVRSGASVSELMQNSGLTQDEATLLIRLHGSDTRL